MHVVEVVCFGLIERIGDVTTTEINGRKYIAVPAEYVEVNGIMAKV